MQPITVTVGPLDAADTNIICETQTPAGAGNLTLDGDAVVDGVAVLDEPRRVLFTPAGAEATNETVWTIYGTDWNGNSVSETVAGVNNPSTAQSLYDYATITRIAVNKAQAGAVIVGTSSVASSRPILLDTFAPAPTALQVTVSGTVNYTVQQSLDDPNSISGGYAAMTWVNHPDAAALVGATATAQGNYAYLPRAVRVTLNSGTGSITMTVIQADV